MATDLQLLLAWRAGDRSAGNALVTRHFAAVHRVFAGRVHPDAVDDLLQRSFLTAVERREDIFEAAGFRAYLLGIARIQLLRYYRELKRDGRMEVFDSGVPDSFRSPSSVLGREQEVALLWDALRTLPLDFQLSLQLYYWENMRTADIAKVLGVAPGTVRSRLARARAALTDALSPLTPPQTTGASAHQGD